MHRLEVKVAVVTAAAQWISAAAAKGLAARVIKRPMAPADLPGAVYYQASEDNEFMTGQCMNVDGGALNY